MHKNIAYLGFLNTHTLSNVVASTDMHAFDFKIEVDSKMTNSEIALEVPSTLMLGKRAELFFEYYLSSYNDYELLIKNIQIFRDKITIGEIDFILKNHFSKQIIHLELVYKFYVYDPENSADEIERWIGPNRKDSLPEKLTKLKEKQLPLLYKEECKQVLEAILIKSDQIRQEVCFFANLFVPISLLGTTLPLINNQCIVGYWIRINDFDTSIYNGYDFYAPNKKDWTIHPKYHQKWKSFNDISQEIKTILEQKKSPLLWMKESEDSFKRFFVVWW